MQTLNSICFTDNEIKAVNTLYGIVMGIISDGKLEDTEIHFLNLWLKDHHRYYNAFPLNIISKQITGILDDGIITEHEQRHLYDTLSTIIGGSFVDTGIASGISTEFPVRPVTELIPNATICFTGKFIFGSRSECESAAWQCGATPVNSVTAKLNYLVIGALSNPNWITESHGRKIEKALHLQGKGQNVLIISEQNWTDIIFKNII